MSKKKHILTGDDRIGRLIRLNRVTLIPGNKGFASLVFWGDLHFGHPQCDTKRAKDMLDYCVKQRIYVVGMGDMMESGLRDSVGDSIYQQKLNPQEQLEFIIELLTPIAKKGLLIGIHEGNHEHRITKSTGIDITKIMAKALGVPYLGYAVWHLIHVGHFNYTMYTTHGSSGSRFKHTKLKAAMDIAAFFEADILAMGHVHSKAAEVIERQAVDLRARTVVEKKVHVILTGSYLKYDKSYAQMKGYPPTTLGSPKIQLFSERWDIHSRV